MSDQPADSYILDAAYKPFPTFEKWNASTSINTVRWDRYLTALNDRGKLTPDVLARARNVATRAAAIDTGAIEGLYEVDRGFTYTVAFETAAWETALDQRGEQVRPLFEAQLHAYDFVLDLATKSEPFSEAAIRQLHVEICEAQETYRVQTAVGPQEQPLPKGRYKILPNHVRTRDGIDHSYAPVDVTPDEMLRLVTELRSESFLAAHPVTQAAYAHYALVVIHPFADGNGRVARALASAFTYRAISMPIVILSEHKSIYLDALEAADSGDLQRFSDFMMARALDTVQLVSESLKTSDAPSIIKSLAALEGLYVTKSGYTHDQVDGAGFKLAELMTEEFSNQTSRLEQEKMKGFRNSTAGQYSVPDTNYRMPTNAGRILTIGFKTLAPVSASVARKFELWVPKDPDRSDDVVFRRPGTMDGFTARLDELLPEVSGVVRLRVRLFVERTMAEILGELAVAAQTRLDLAR
jgi:Fic family protein